MTADPATPEARLRAFCDAWDSVYPDACLNTYGARLNPDDIRAVLDRLARAEEAQRTQLRQAMAAYAQAYTEPDRDEETPEDARKSTAEWFAHWMVNNYPSAHEHEAHSGDCTKQPWTCMRCRADLHLADADAALAAWDARAALRGKDEP